MNRKQWNLIVFLSLCLVLSLVVAHAGAMNEPAQFGWEPNSPHMNWRTWEEDRTPVLRALDPEEVPRCPPQTDQPVRLEQFAILPEPVNGRELVDQILTTQRGQPAEGVEGQAATPRRLHQRERIEPGYVVPVCHGM